VESDVTIASTSGRHGSEKKKIPFKICCFVAASKGVKANIHHEILKKHLVPWTNRSIIFNGSERFNGNVKKENLGTLLVTCVLPAAWPLYSVYPLFEST
jgi:hypothetical protein